MEISRRADFSEIPIIDIEPLGREDAEEAKVIAAIRDACEHVGFFYICNHGVPRHEMQNIFKACERFFSLPQAERDRIYLEPISKSPEEDNEASELYEAEEVPGVVFPTDEDAALPLNPSKEALHEPASHIAAQPSPILRGRLASVAAMRRDHLDAVLAQLLIEWIAIVGAIANQILRLGLDHVEVEA